MILAACSPLFKSILVNQAKHAPNPNPVILLRGISSSQIEHILDFIYHGECNIQQSELNSFLAVAEELKIRGLTQEEEQIIKKQAKKTVKRDSTNINNSNPLTAIKQRKVQQQQQQQQQPQQQQQHQPSTSEPEISFEQQQQQEQQQDQFINYDQQQQQSQGEDPDVKNEDALLDPDTDPDTLIRRRISGVEGVVPEFECAICGKVATKKHDLKRHVQAKHVQSRKWNCHLCDGQFSTQHARQSHYKIKHSLALSTKEIADMDAKMMA